MMGAESWAMTWLAFASYYSVYSRLACLLHHRGDDEAVSIIYAFICASCC